ncbi:MAG: di-trans,poly-cis-decaprenylcistransferase [Selenomonadaceae bacterium]|nr:di-trans,poly-cis-decaprenylcistransferase [Selenomonadaceae bacterium]MBQ4403825.1 di-trans,poly-cis-decaprenylcistransferase [Selenomonadaceae bacterium]
MWESDGGLLARVDKAKMPRHVAIIMDGNGRWASYRGLLRSAGHTAGVKTLKNILKTAVNLKLEALTVYAFSTENWKRPHAEVDFLMHLFSEYLEREKLEMHQNNVRIKFLGRTEDFAPSLQKLMRDSVELMKNNTGVKFNVAADYGGQDEIIRAAQKLARRVKAGELSPENISTQMFEDELDTAGQPPVDLLIRTSGDLRVSNFLLWQAAYAEFWFTDTPWPEFTPEEFIDALIDFGKRNRRFGALNT